MVEFPRCLDYHCLVVDINCQKKGLWKTRLVTSGLSNNSDNIRHFFINLHDSYNQFLRIFYKVYPLILQTLRNLYRNQHMSYFFRLTYIHEIKMATAAIDNAVAKWQWPVSSIPPQNPRQ
jgi:hypothetical protein